MRRKRAKSTVPKTKVLWTEDEPDWSRIRLLSIKLRSLGSLIGTQATDEEPPLDYWEVQWGYGMILEGIAEEMRTTSAKMERSELEKGRLGKKI